MDTIRPRDQRGKFSSNPRNNPCVDCDEKSPQNFYYHASGRQNGIRCKSCRSKILRDKGITRMSNLRRKYGLTVVEYEQMYQLQKGLCAVCGNPETGMDNTRTGTRALAVDHDHETGVVRQLLCGSCNYLLGCAKDDADLLQSASNYLRKHQAGASCYDDARSNTLITAARKIRNG